MMSAKRAVIEHEFDDVDRAVRFLIFIGAEKNASQETLREMWALDNAKITSDAARDGVGC